MGKRSNFEKFDKDAYMTIDPRATEPLIDYFGNGDVRYYEPCAGDGSLIKLLSTSNFICTGSSDIERDARTTQYSLGRSDCFITNPPWSRSLLHPIIENLRVQRPTWLLFDSDWMHTQQAIPHLAYCKTIISIGRVRWIPNTDHDGKDNCAWYLFVKEKTKCEFIPRTKRVK